MDAFPEAFERFEDDVDVYRFSSYHELTLAFRWWAGEKWRGTARQWEALNIEAENLGFEVPLFIREEIRDAQTSGYYVSKTRQEIPQYRHEIVTVKGYTQDRYRDLKTGRFIKKP